MRRYARLSTVVKHKNRFFPLRQSIVLRINLGLLRNRLTASKDSKVLGRFVLATIPACAYETIDCLKRFALRTMRCWRPSPANPGPRHRSCPAVWGGKRTVVAIPARPFIRFHSLGSGHHFSGSPWLRRGAHRRALLPAGQSSCFESRGSSARRSSIQRRWASIPAQSANHRIPPTCDGAQGGADTRIALLVLTKPLPIELRDLGSW